MIGSAKQSGGLYLLEHSPHSPNSTNKTTSSESQFNHKFLGSLSRSQFDTQIQLWHYRLGHPNVLYLEKIFPSLFINKSSAFDCEFCQLAKHTKSHYPSLPYKPSKPFSLIHSDVW
ncbi:unnamed protein product, partial [Cuscuta europaea]